MKLWSDSFKEGGYIPGEFAFCVVDPATHVRLAHNRNPHLAWNDIPEGTKSLALICHDMDVPSRGDDVNQDDKTVPADLPRVDFFHWVLIDLAAKTTAIEAAHFSDGVTAKGKPGPEMHGSVARQGINDYTSWFATDPAMAGDYYGYDGPCPPWNDSIVHRYVFTLYALDIERVPVTGRFSGKQVRDGIHGHILAEAELLGLYTLNPFLVQPGYGEGSKK
jgi:Raf kinase inhibitor-like YbhB/YbcL family protein